MARRRRAVKRVILPDTRYNSVVASRFINKMMWGGKKSTSERIFYGAMQIIEKEARKSPLEIFEQAIKGATPLVEVRSRRVGGATYPIPTEVRGDRGLSLAMKWLILAARAKTGKPMAVRLAQELIDASKGQGTAAKKREDLHKMAEANRAFAHYKW